MTLGTVSNGLTIAGPNEPGMLDRAGLETASPQLVPEVARRAL